MKKNNVRERKNDDDEKKKKRRGEASSDGKESSDGRAYASMVTLAFHVSPGCRTMGLIATAFSTQMKSL